MPKKPIKLSTTARKHLEAFDEAAQTHGWHSDQGSPLSALRAEEAYMEAREKLVKYMSRLANPRCNRTTFTTEYHFENRTK